MIAARTSRLGIPLAIVLASGAAALGVASCVGDDPRVAPAGSDGGGDDAGTPVADTGTPTSDTGTGSETGLTCTPPQTACGSTCVDLNTSADNCSACGRSCGGAACTSGVCGVALVRDNISELNGFDVDATSVYFTSADTINKCALGACTGAVTQLGAMGQYPAEQIFQDSGFVYFQSAPVQSTQRPAIYRCPVSGCANPPPSLMADGLNGIGDYKTFDKSIYAFLGGSGIQRVDCSSGACSAPSLYVPRPGGNNTFAVDAQHIYFNDPADGGTGISMCGLAAGCPTRATVTSTTALGPMVAVGNLLYFIGPGFSGGMGVLACPTSGACGVPTPLRKTADAIPNLAADANGIFWTEAGNLLTCASIQCPGGPKTIATGLGSPTLLHLDAKFAYFVNAGTNANTSAIRRIARP